MKNNRFMLIRKYTLSFMLLVFVQVAVAQQLPQFTNYMINNFVVNPAVAGSNSYFEGISTNRYQWVGLVDAPRTYILTTQGPLKNLNMGLGGVLYTDVVGPTRRTGISLSYAYHMNLTAKVKLSLGVAFGLNQFVLDGSKITMREKSDKVILDGIQSDLSPDFAAGAYIYPVDKKWFLSASVPQILDQTLDFDEVNATLKSSKTRHYYLAAGYKLKLNNNIDLAPSAAIKYMAPTPLLFDLSLRAIYNNKVWIGASYRHLDAVAAMVGYNLNANINFIYSYDFTTSNIKNYSSGTHELMIGLKFHKVKPKPKADVIAKADVVATETDTSEPELAE